VVGKKKWTRYLVSSKKGMENFVLNKPDKNQKGKEKKSWGDVVRDWNGMLDGQGNDSRSR